MNMKTKSFCSNKNITLPNILSVFRIFLIPFIVYEYCFRTRYAVSALLLLASGLTDVADGFIARRFAMSSDLGKAIDPIADKLTQLTVMLCLLTRFSFMMFPFTILLAKEILAGIIGIITIRKTGTVPYAKWHGKLCTVVLYGVLFCHIIFFNLSIEISTVLILISVSVMLLSSILYTVTAIHLLFNHKTSAHT